MYVVVILQTEQQELTEKVAVNTGRARKRERERARERESVTAIATEDSREESTWYSFSSLGASQFNCPFH